MEEKEKRLEFTKEQLEFMENYNIRPDNSLETTDKLYDLLMTKGFGGEGDVYIPTEIGLMCEDILDTIADYDNDGEYVDDFESDEEYVDEFE